MYKALSESQGNAIIPMAIIALEADSQMAMPFGGSGQRATLPLGARSESKSINETR
jgi:hypothetical protein